MATSVTRRFWLYSYACIPLSSQSYDNQYHILLFCVDPELRTHVIQVQNYHTSILVKPDRRDFASLNNDTDNLLTQVDHYLQRKSMFLGKDLIGFTNSKKKPIIQLFLRNEADRQTVIKSIYKRNSFLGRLRVKQILNTRFSAETQFLYDSGLHNESWFEATVCPNPHLREFVDNSVFETHFVDMSLKDQLMHLNDRVDVAPKLRKCYVRMVAHSSTATQTYDPNPSDEIPADQVRYIAFQMSDDPTTDDTTLLDIQDFDNNEARLLLAFGKMIEERNVHTFVYSADERCEPNSLVYLCRRAKQHGINLHFSKMTQLALTCEVKMCKGGEFLDFKHPGAERVDMCAVLKKAMVNPNLDGFTILDALRHPKLVMKQNKEGLKKLYHLNYHGINSFSTREQIREDIHLNTKLLRTLEQDGEFVSTQRNLARICHLDLTSVVERGQQARIRNLFGRSYHKEKIVINDERVKKPYRVVRKDRDDSSYPEAPWLENPPVESLRGETPPRHIIRKALPPHLEFLHSIEHNNVFQIEPPKPKPNPSSVNEIIPAPPPPVDFSMFLPDISNLPVDISNMFVTEEEAEEGKEEFSEKEEDEEKEQDVHAPTGWWSNRHANDFVAKSKKRKKKQETEAEKDAKKRYRGAVVLDTISGFLTLPEELAATVDFGSLYPSIIQANELCYMRVIYKKKWLDDPNLEIEYVPITPTECLALAKAYKNKETGQFEPVETITPQIVRGICKMRSDIRTRQKSVAYGTFEWNTLERDQLAAKVVQNSVYGYIGSATSGMTCTALAAAVTQIGQWMNRSVRFLILFLGGFVLGGDTDSCQARFWVKKSIVKENDIYQNIYEQGHRLQKLGTSMFKPPNVLELECFKGPFLVLKKKTYAAIQLSPKPNGWLLPPDDKINIKGLAAKKRDRCGYAQQIGLGLVDRLMKKQTNIDLLVGWMHSQLVKIPKGKITTIEELNPFIITCALSHEYKKTEGVLALHLADMIQKETGARPRPGTRLSYVSIHTPNKQQSLHCECCVTPDVFLQQQHCIDIEYYLQTQILKCIKQILSLPVHRQLYLALENVIGLYTRTWNNKMCRSREITDFFRSASSQKKEPLTKSNN